MSPSPILGVFAKQPREGAVKTRLAELTSPAWAVRVAEAFLRDTLARLALSPPRKVIVFAPTDAGTYFADLDPSWELAPQAAGDLGQRLYAFMQAQFAAGAPSVVVIGTDSPTLPIAYIADAFSALNEVDVVLGPASDGGYYLLGCRRFLPQLFEHIPWSTAQVLEKTVQRLGGASFRLLPPWYDVDTLEDWELLRGHVLALRLAGQDPGLIWTQSLLDE